MYNLSMLKEYFEDITLYQKHRSKEYHLTEKEIISFAKSWDNQPFHIDPEFAKNTRFAGLIASGIHLVAILGKLLNERNPRPAFIAGLGFDKVRFVSPARPDDVLVLETEAITKRESKSNPNVGIVCYACRLLNQRDEPLVTGEPTGLVEKRTRY
jgi:acyl dehydratase